jgi:seryl-tRNA synthetase
LEELEEQGSESDDIATSRSGKEVAGLNGFSAADLIATLNSLKTEEQDLLREREHLQKEESELQNQAFALIDEKKKALQGLKSEILFLQNKCNELEQALGIPVYK